MIRMARANLGRNKKKTFLVVISLSLAVVLLQATYTFALGFDMDKFLEKWVVSDFILGDADYFQYHYQGSGEALPQEDIAAVEAEGELPRAGAFMQTAWALWNMLRRIYTVSIFAEQILR